MVKTFGDVIDLDEVILGKEFRDQLMPGAKAGPWRIEGELGKGGMGTVYAVVHEEIGKRAALKVMHRDCLAGGAHRIRNEGRLANQVAHPGIVDIFETGTLPDGRPYIVMEHLEGMTLGERARDGKILPDEVIAILLELSNALLAAHNAGVIHRDLKLDNVFLTTSPARRVKLLDWSIAKVITSELFQTMEGVVSGTPYYLSPEQAAGRPVSAKTDVYSLGVMAYELFLEQLPFDAETVAEVLVLHLRMMPPPPSELWPSIPGRLEDLLLAMLAKEPNDRPTLVEVMRLLEAVRDDIVQRRATGSTPPKIQPITEAPKRSRSHSRVAGALLTLAIGTTTLATVHSPVSPIEAAATSNPPTPTTPATTHHAAAPRVTQPSQPSVVHVQPVVKAPAPAVATRALTLEARSATSRPAPAVRSTPQVRIAPPTSHPPQPVTVEELVAQYQAVGRQLKALDDRGSDATLDLWPRYRMIQLQVALASAELRTATATRLALLMDAATVRKAP